jgi:hypothetical protein
MKLSFLFASVAIAASLAACGGGGGSNDTTPVQKLPETALSKYTGIWQRCSQESYGSRLGEVTIGTPDASGTAKINFQRKYYTSVDCTGSSFAVLKNPDAYFDFQGTKTIATGEVTDKILVRRLEGPIQIEGAVIYTNDPVARPVVAVTIPTASSSYYITVPTTEAGTTMTIHSKAYLTAGTGKDFLYLLNGDLINGDSKSALDTDGYPTIFDISALYKKKP